jgi:hypothetical protein
LEGLGVGKIIIISNKVNSKNMEANLQQILDHLVQIRVNFKKVLESMPEEKLFEIPKGFKNHIMWNFAHNVVTQQALVYRLAGLPVIVSDELINKYRKGTEATPEIIKGFREEIIVTSFSTLEKTQKDILTPEIFKNYSPYATSFGVELKSATEAMLFNNVHEGLHLGYAMAIRKAIS